MITTTAINMEYYGRIDPALQYRAMCTTTDYYPGDEDAVPYVTRAGFYEQHGYGTFVRCEYCRVKNGPIDPYCQSCGAPLP